MPRRGRKNDENSTSGSDSDPDFVVPRYSSRTNLHSVRRSTRNKRTRDTKAPINAEIRNGSIGRRRQIVNQPRGSSPMKMNGKWTILSWLVNSKTIDAGTRVQYRDGNVRLRGEVSSDGILCSCCNCTITVKEFESHARSSKHLPYLNTYTGTGKSLLQCQIEAWDKQGISACKGFQEVVDIQKDDVNMNDDICNICGGDGKLTCCDICPLTYHEDCIGIKTLPQVAFHCPICVCTICGIDGYKAPSLRCFQCEELCKCSCFAIFIIFFHCPICVCTICGIDGYKAPSLRCFQCEELYHWNCLRGAAVYSEGNYFCGNSCKEVNEQLQKFLGVPHKLGDGLSWTLNQRIDPLAVSHHRLSKRMECNAKVALAYAVYNECFEPIIDSRTGLDRIPTVAFNCGSNLSRLNCRGFYTFSLEKEDEIIAVASIRVRGTKLAEMPFIGTREKYRGKGMCRRLVDTIVSVLISLNVEKLVLPSASERVHYWTTYFQFTHVDKIQRREMSSKNLMVFRDTVLLEKTLLLHDGSNEAKTEATEALKLKDNNEPDKGPRDREQSCPKPLLFDLDLNLEPPNEEVKDGPDAKPSLGIFLTLDPDGSLHLKRFFVNKPPETLQSYLF